MKSEKLQKIIIFLPKNLFNSIYLCTFAPAFETIEHWRDGRVVDYSSLENYRAERHRGFESLSLRKKRKPNRFPFLFSIHSELPFILPADNGLAVFEVDGQPDVSGITRMIGSPDISHEDVFSVLKRQNKRTLSFKGLVGLRSTTGVGMLCPRSPYARCGEHTGFVGCPTCTA